MSFAASFLLCGHGALAGETSATKYGKDAVPLHLTNDYFRESPALTYWALSPYYAGQETNASCGLASAVMIVNAAKVQRVLKDSEPLATQKGLLKRLNNPAWNKTLADGGDGLSLESFKRFLEESLKVYDVTRFKLEVVHTTAAMTDRIRRDLQASKNIYIVANFLQGVYTGSAMVGHFAPVGAYDSKRRRVLIMDPDREWYEPYWVSEETFLKGMATVDKDSGQSRGYVRVEIL